MRQYAYLKKKRQEENRSILKIMWMETEGGFSLFEYDSLTANVCCNDRFYSSMEELYDDWKDDIDERGWMSLSDPLPDCQHDAFFPTRVKGRSKGNPQWGKYEILWEGKWIDYDPKKYKIINDRILYIEETDDPLSADIGIIKDGEYTWLYDVGNDEERIKDLTGNYLVVLSHFHQDHVGNLDRIHAEQLYVSKETFDHVHQGELVNEDLSIGNVHIFPLPSCHTKGSLGLEIDETYAFVADALYSRVRDNYYIYNAQILKQEIEVLKGLKSIWLLISHYPGMLRRKEEVLQELQEIYAMRNGNDPEILVPRK